MSFYYQHPQGGKIIVEDDGTLQAYKASGHKKKTSATAATLREGHGRWEEVAPFPVPTIEKKEKP